MHRQATMAASVAAALGVLTLAGCGGGGGGGSNVRPDDPFPPPVVSPPRTIVQTTVEGGETIRVGVVDSEFNIEHEQLQGRVAEAFFVRGGEPEPGTPENLRESSFTHGTPVASAVLQASGNAELVVVRASAFNQRPPDINGIPGSLAAIEAGARVMNHSYVGVNGSYFGEFIHGTETVEAAINAHDGRGVAIITSAGNRGGQVSLDRATYWLEHPETEALYDQFLSVGIASGNQPSSYTDVPGGNPLDQARHIMAPTVNGTFVGLADGRSN